MSTESKVVLAAMAGLILWVVYQLGDFVASAPKVACYKRIEAAVVAVDTNGQERLIGNYSTLPADMQNTVSSQLCKSGVRR